MAAKKKRKNSVKTKAVWEIKSSSNKLLMIGAAVIVIIDPEVIEKIPYYCGFEGIGHTSLLSCYISSDGSYSSHASNCDICVEEVLRIKKLYESGMYISEIKEIIDNEYSKYGDGKGGVPITEDFNINFIGTPDSVLNEVI